MTLKRCTKCCRDLSCSQFWKQTSSKDGLASWCKECRTIIHAAWQKNNKNQVNSQHRDHYKTPQQQAKKRAYNLEHREQKRKNEASYRERNRQRYRLLKSNNNAKRRAIKQAVEAEHVDREKVYARDNGRCYICLQYVSYAEFQLDHIRPITKDGPHTYDNVAVTCRSCNAKKGNRFVTFAFRECGPQGWRIELTMQ